MGLHVYHLPTQDNADAEGIGELINTLASNDGLRRRKARLALVDRDGAAVPDLMRALNHPNRDVRWEATKALGEIKDPLAAEALVRTLRDDRFGVRWLAAEALIALGPAGLSPLMEALWRQSDQPLLRHGAHHVLRGLARDHELPQPVKDVMHALEGIEPAVELPPLAYAALKHLRGGKVESA